MKSGRALQKVRRLIRPKNRKEAAKGARREGPGTVQPGKAPPIGEAHAGKDLSFGAEATGNRQADERRDERNEKT